MHRIARQIYHTINQANKIMLIPHPNPDGDALGSVSAFMQYLRSLGKSHVVYCKTKASPKLNFLPHTDYLTYDPNIWTDYQPDLLVVFDTGDLNYAGIKELIEKLDKKPKIVNFDHHNTNVMFGDLNMVQKTASSTTEVLYDFFRYNNIKINAETSTCLLTGLMTDTDNFTNGATTIKSMSIASDLINKGGNAELIRGWVFKDKSINALKLWGAVLSRLEKHEKHDIAHTYLTQKDLKKYNVTDDEAEGIANFMNSLKDGRAALILKEISDKEVKGSFRTTRDDTDVSIWAKALGGGGHKKAAGFTILGSIEHALEQVFSVIELSEQTEA